jgi:hypothetical protein
VGLVLVIPTGAAVNSVKDEVEETRRKSDVFNSKDGDDGDAKPS